MCAVMFVAGKRTGAAASASSSSRRRPTTAQLLEMDADETTDRRIGKEDISEEVLAEASNAANNDTLRCFLRTRKGTVLSGQHLELVEAVTKEMRQ